MRRFLAPLRWGLRRPDPLPVGRGLRRLRRASHPRAASCRGVAARRRGLSADAGRDRLRMPERERRILLPARARRWEGGRAAPRRCSTTRSSRGFSASAGAPADQVWRRYRPSTCAGILDLYTHKLLDTVPFVLQKEPCRQPAGYYECLKFSEYVGITMEDRSEGSPKARCLPPPSRSHPPPSGRNSATRSTRRTATPRSCARPTSRP